MKQLRNLVLAKCNFWRQHTLRIEAYVTRLKGRGRICETCIDAVHHLMKGSREIKEGD